MKMEVAKDKKGEKVRRYRSKVTKGNRIVIPKEIMEMYQVKEDDVVEWIDDGEGNTKIEIKEIVLRDKKVKKEK